MSTPDYQVGETVEITINGPITYTSIAEEHVTPAELTVTLRTPSGPYDVTVPLPASILPGEPVNIRRYVPAEGQPLPGDVWEDAAGRRWFAVEDSQGRVMLTADGARQHYPPQVHEIHVLVKRLFRADPDHGLSLAAAAELVQAGRDGGQ